MKKIVLSILMLIIPLTIQSQVKAVTEKGETIIVYKNGTWKKSNIKKSVKTQRNVTVRVDIDDFTGIKRITTGDWGNFGQNKYDSSMKISGSLLKAKELIAFDIFYQGDLGCLEGDRSKMNVKLTNGEVIDFISMGDSDCKNSHSYRFLPLRIEDFNDERFQEIMQVNLAKLENFDWEVIRITGSKYYVDIVPSKSVIIKFPEQFFRQHIKAANKK